MERHRGLGARGGGGGLLVGEPRLIRRLESGAASRGEKNCAHDKGER